MVNPGHPSRGCATCKLRRIKCDQAQPRCQKCESSKRLCLGYDRQNLAVSKRTAKVHTSGLQSEDALSAAWTLRKPHPVQSIVVPGPAIMSEDSKDPKTLSDSPKLEQYKSAVQYEMEPINSGFQSLQASSCTLSAHKNLQKRYQYAIHDLSSTLALSRDLSSSCHQAYLFTLYEVGFPTITLYLTMLMYVR